MKRFFRLSQKQIKFIFDSFTIITGIITLAWLWCEPGFEPLLGIVVSLTSFLKAQSILSEQDSISKQDFEKLREKLIDFIHIHKVKSRLKKFENDKISINLEYRPDMLDIETFEERDLLRNVNDIYTIFNAPKISKELLILGPPGSGKTSLMLTLADVMLQEARKDVLLSVPVTLNLSSWGEKQLPLRQWVTQELQNLYNVPDYVTNFWLQNNAIALFLDGLDEVPTNQRDACVEAINEFNKIHIIDIVVTCRTTDYIFLTKKLNLKGCLIIKPIDSEEIHKYLLKNGINKTEQKVLLSKNPEILHLINSPWALNMFLSVYSNLDMKAIKDIDTIEKLRAILINSLVTEFLRNSNENNMKNHNSPHFSEQDSIKYLTWLAKYMDLRNQPEFIIDWVQPDALPPNSEKQYRRKMWWIFCICIFLQIALAFILPISQIFGWYIGSVFTLGVSGAIGSIGSMFWIDINNEHKFINLVKQTQFTSQSKLSKEKIGDMVYKLTSGVSSGIAFVLFSYLVSYALMPMQINNPVITNALTGLLAGGICAGFGFAIGTHRFMSREGVLGGAFVGFAFSLLSTLAAGEDAGKYFSLIGGLTCGFTLGIAKMFTNKLNLKDPIICHQAINDTLKNANNSLFIGVLGSVAWCAGWLFLFWGQILDANIFYLLPLIILLPGSSWLMFGGNDYLKHKILLRTLFASGNTPKNWNEFLKHATEKKLLENVGGHYIFPHPLIMEHFANRNDSD